MMQADTPNEIIGFLVVGTFGNTVTLGRDVQNFFLWVALGVGN